MKTKTKKICITAMGIALFVVLALCLQVPVFENYYLCLGYIAMMVFCYYFGPAAGSVVGFLGVVLYCLLINGLRGMPGWAVGNIVIGIIVGSTCKATIKMKNVWLKNILIVLAIVLSTAVAMLGVKSLVESILYAQPMVVRIAKNIYAFVADVVVLIVGLPICTILQQPINKIFKNEIIKPMKTSTKTDTEERGEKPYD